MLREDRDVYINEKKHRGWLKLIIILLIAALVIFIFAKLSKTTEYVIEGNARYTDEEIIARLVTGKTDEYAPLLYIKYKLQDDVNIPFVDYIDMELTSLDSIKLYVYEKIVCGCVDVMGRYMFFDKDGIVTESSNTRSDGIPVVSGLRFDSILIGEKLELGNDTVFNKILNLTLNIQKYGCKVDEIHFNTDYTVVFYCGESRALMGNRTTYEEVIKVLAAMLESSDGQALEYNLQYYDSNNKNVIAKPIG